MKGHSNNNPPETVWISIYPADNLFFAVGVSPRNQKIVKIFLPQTSREKIQEQVTLEFPHFQLTEKYQPLLKKIVKIYKGDCLDFDRDMLDLSTEKSKNKAGPVPNDFDLKVLGIVAEIPRGEVRTYKEVAESLGGRAWRAVGSAMARNPFPLVIPCHRVVRSDLNLGNYGGGVEMKRELLKKEGVKIKGLRVVRP
jgi:methylated-DNA-[protein]-cysteine S-methyltransferase